MEQKEWFLHTLYESYRDVLYKSCCRQLGFAWDKQHLAEDCVQEVFVQAYLHYEKLRDHPNPKAWLFTVLGHRIKDAMRKRRIRQRREVHGMEEPTPYAANQPDDPASQLARDDYADHLILDILDILDPRETEIYMMYFMKRMKMREIAKEKQLSDSAVKGIIYRIRQKAKRVREGHLLLLIAYLALSIWRK